MAIGKLKRSAAESEELWKVKVDTAVAKVENECSSRYSELHRKYLQSERLNSIGTTDSVCQMKFVV